MPDYVYLLENRLSPDQRHALQKMRETARQAGMLLFLTGDAVRDLTSGHAVRSLEVAVHGNALKLKKALEAQGAAVWGEHAASQALYLCFPGTVRVDVLSSHTVSYPKPGKPVYQPASIQEDLRQRDFTVNAMAISLNEGSYGLFMDPLNGAADVETRTLRLVSNYGFIDDPSLLIRATRYKARLGWELDSRTQTRYENAKGDEVIQYLNEHSQSRELEQIGHEEDALAILRVLEAEGWMQHLFPAWTSAKADEEKLKALHELAVELLIQGVHADMSAAQMQLLTAKMSAKDLAELKKRMLRPGLVAEWDSLDQIAAAFQKALLAKENQTPSISYKLFTCFDPEAVLWLGFTSKSAAVQERYKLFLKTWPEAKQKTPYALMQEMRITSELPIYTELVQNLFLELIDGKLTTNDEMKAYLEPHSPPAPPPQVTVKRSRRRAAETKIKEDSFDDEESDEDQDGDEDLDDIGGGEDEEVEIDLKFSKDDQESDDEAPEADFESDDDEEDSDEKPRKSSSKAAPKPTKAVKAKVEAHPAKPLAHSAKSAPHAAKAKSASEPKKDAHPVKIAPKNSAKVPAKVEPKAVVKVEAKAKAAPKAEVKKAAVKPALAPKKAAHPAKVVHKTPVKSPAKPEAKGKASHEAKKPAKKH
jgi:tRNA nucleotidyltransferase/poly(A) polymerase